MAKPKYIQLDAGIFADNKVGILVRKFGAAGFAVYVYCLIEIGRQSNYPNMEISINSIFTESAALLLDISIDDFDEIIQELFRLGLLLDHEGFAYSHGFNIRTGKKLMEDNARSVTQKQKALPAAKPAPKPKKAKPEPPATAEAEKVISAIQAFSCEASDMPLGNAKNRGSNLSGVQAQKLIDKHSLDWVMAAIPVFYQWKFTTKKAVKSDYLSFLADWLSEKVKDSPKPVF